MQERKGEASRSVSIKEDDGGSSSANHRSLARGVSGGCTCTTYQCKNMGSFPFKTSITVSISSKTFDTVNNMTHNPAAPSPYPACVRYTRYIYKKEGSTRGR